MVNFSINCVIESFNLIYIIEVLNMITYVVKNDIKLRIKCLLRPSLELRTLWAKCTNSKPKWKAMSSIALTLYNDMTTTLWTFNRPWVNLNRNRKVFIDPVPWSIMFSKTPNKSKRQKDQDQAATKVCIQLIRFAMEKAI